MKTNIAEKKRYQLFALWISFYVLTSYYIYIYIYGGDIVKYFYKSSCGFTYMITCLLSPQGSGTWHVETTLPYLPIQYSVPVLPIHHIYL